MKRSRGADVYVENQQIRLDHAKMAARIAILLAVAVALGGCAAVQPAPYQRVTLGMWAGWNGYLDKEIAPGVHIVEVTQIGGYVHNMDVLKAHWIRRAKELCPDGYSGQYEVILPHEAKLEELRCNRNYCQQYPMVSGIIRCQRRVG